MIDLSFEKKLHAFVLRAIKDNLIKSAHDCSEGGLAVALAECCISDRERLIGASVRLQVDLRVDALYYGESQSRIVLSAAPADKSALQQLADSMGIPLVIIGEVGDDHLNINDDIRQPLLQLAPAYHDTIAQIMG